MEKIALKIVTPVLFFAALAFVYHFSSPNIPDADSFFYIRQAWRYRTAGLFNTEFPWLYHTVIRGLSASLWYGFSFLLIPFTYFRDLVFGIKFAGGILTASALLVFYWTTKRHCLRLSTLWPLLFFFSSPNVLFRFLMTRTQLISLALSPLLFSFFVSRNLWGIFFATFGIVWVHPNFIWLPFLIAIGVNASSAILDRRIHWRGILSVISGVLLGVLLRPNPIDAAKLLYIQLVQHTLEKQAGLPLLFGFEHYPLSVAVLFRNFLPFLLLWGAAAAILIQTWLKGRFKERPSPEKILLIGSLGISSLFFLMTLVVARRAYDLWTAFGAIFIAGTYTYLLPLISGGRGVRFGKYVVAAALVFMIPYATVKNGESMAKQAYPPDHFKEIGLWLAKNSQPGEIVFNLHWSDFSPLFFWNQKNYYVGGLDPIFEYAYDPGLYWKFHYLSADEVTKKTCGAPACTAEMLEDTYQVVVRDFGAKYVVLTKQQNPAVYFFLESDPRFEKKLDTKREALYLVRQENEL